MSKAKQNIDLDNIIWETVKNNKMLFISLPLILLGFYFEQFSFSKGIGNFITQITEDTSIIDKIDIKMVALLVFPYILSQIIFYTANVIDSYSIPEMELSIIKKVSSQIFDSIRTTKHQVNINELIMNMKKMVSAKHILRLFTVYVIPVIILSLGIIIYISIYDIKIGLICLVCLIISGILLFKLSLTCADLTVDDENEENYYFDDLYDIFNNIDAIVTSGTSQSEINQMNDKNLYESTINKELCGGKVKFLSPMIYLVVMLILDGSAVLMYQRQLITEGTMIAIFLIVFTMLQYYDSLGYEIKTLISYIGQYMNLRKYLGQFKIDNTLLKNNFHITKGNVEIKNMTVRMGNKIILNNFSTQIKGQSMTLITGKNGTGKSTLLKSLTGLVNYDGKILVDGQNLKDYKHESIMKYVSYIPQNSKLFNRSIYANLAYGTRHNKNYIMNVLAKYNLTSFISNFEKGLDTVVGKNGERVSGGQRQIIYILRSIIQNKKIILLDEPTASLDQYHKNIVIKLLKAMKGKTIIVVSHDRDIMPYFDQTLRLRGHNDPKN